MKIGKISSLTISIFDIVKNDCEKYVVPLIIMFYKSYVSL